MAMLRLSTQHPKARQKQPELDRNGPKGIEMDILQALWGGEQGGLVGKRGAVCKGKRNHYPIANPQRTL